LQQLLLALYQCLLRMSAVGDVTRVDDDAAHGRVVQQILADVLEPAVSAVLMPDPEFRGIDRLSLVHHLREALRRHRDLALVDEREDAASRELFRSPAEQPLDRRA